MSATPPEDGDAARAMILAAGLGTRLRPLTDHTPKPLVEVAGVPLIAYGLCLLRDAGIRDVVVNLHHLGERVMSGLGDGSRYGVRIAYSHEPKALETAGGIVQALHLLGDAPFAVVSADIYTEFDYRRLEAPLRDIAADTNRHIAHFVLVDNPPFHAKGDDMGVFGAIARYDLQTGRSAVHEFGAGREVDEPLFVPRPRATGESDGWIMTYVYDRATDGSVLARQRSAKPPQNGRRSRFQMCLRNRLWFSTSLCVPDTDPCSSCRCCAPIKSLAR